MNSDMPKVMHAIAGRPMISHLISTLDSIRVDRICVVVGPDMPEVAAAVAPCPTAVQVAARGTGDAVLSARESLGDLTGDVLVVFGADPLVSTETLGNLVARRRQSDNPAVAVLGFCPPDPTGYGRLIRGSDGSLDAIIEHKEASPEQRAVTMCNAGSMVIDGTLIWSLLERVTNDNAKGEFYLTDIIGIARGDGHACALVEGDAWEQTGVDSRHDLAEVEACLQKMLRRRAMDNGATLIAPGTVWFSYDTVLGRDVIVEPNVIFGPGVTVRDNVRIRASSHLEGCVVRSGAVVGPFARLRPGTNIGEDAHIGNFVEVKNATIGNGSKASHLSYVGDSTVGTKTNIGAGTITANYDGVNKHHTTIGDGASIGSNAVLVAPVSVGDGATVAAGSTITRDVEPDALAITRAGLRVISGWAARLRAGNGKNTGK